MKKFTQSIINEACTTASKNPGNNLVNTGVTNHYTPIQNIITNIKNLFCVHLGIVADEGEDGVSVKLTSSLFVNDQKINELLYMPLFNDVNYEGSCLASYIQAQGLTKITKVNIGGYIIVYFSPTDIQQAQDPNAMCKAGWCPMEAKESLYDEFEMTSIIKEDEEEKEVQDITLEKVLELLESDDKVKAAKELELLVSKQISLPREYYFAAVKFKSGKEGIALRWKFTKNLPGGETTENVSVHQLLTIASIIELEGNNSENRSKIASVIYNRLNANMSLGSDVTTYYAIRVDMGERDLYAKEIIVIYANLLKNY